MKIVTRSRPAEAVQLVAVSPAVFDYADPVPDWLEGLMRAGGIEPLPAQGSVRVATSERGHIRARVGDWLIATPGPEGLMVLDVIVGDAIWREWEPAAATPDEVDETDLPPTITEGDLEQHLGAVPETGGAALP